jgi:hypothetical protein
MTVLDQPVIARRFHGPPTSANGGYACGVVAAPIEGVAQVTLRTPPPLERPMQLVVTGTAVTLRDGDTVVADGAPANLEREPVAPFPSCFVCGPDRAEGDGLRIFPGPVAGRTVAAAPWTPHASLDDGRGHVRREAVWAALDCPSYFGMQVVAPERITALLGRLVARIDRAPRIDEPCVAVGWLLGRDGRKIHAGSALYAADGELLGLARATWIEVPAAR